MVSNNDTSPCRDRCVFGNKKKNTLTFHTALYPVDELVGLAAVEQSSDGGEGVQDDGLRMGINVVLIFFFKKEEKKHVIYPV